MHASERVKRPEPVANLQSEFGEVRRTAINSRLSSFGTAMPLTWLGITTTRRRFVDHWFTSIDAGATVVRPAMQRGASPLCGHMTDHLGPIAPARSPPDRHARLWEQIGGAAR